MNVTITRLFGRYEEANSALHDLLEAGVSREDISIVANTSDDEFLDAGETSQTAEGAGTGAGIGGVIGGGAGLLAGLGVIAIPGLGPVVAAGWLAATAAGLVCGAAAGAAAGGVVGALMETGVSEDHARVFVEGVRRGGTLLTVRIDEKYADEVRQVLDTHGPIDPDQRGTDLRSEGWEPYSDDTPLEPAIHDRAFGERRHPMA
jgi:hypothetical protein